MKRGRVKPNWYHILVALAQEDLHGLGIVRSVLDQTEDAVRLWPATLYGSLESMSEEGLIAELEGREHPDGVSSQRRYYRITEAGRDALRAEARRLQRLAAMGLRRLEEA